MQSHVNYHFFKPKISFHNNDSLTISIETQRLFIHSYSPRDFKDCLSLYGNAHVTKYFDHGKPRKTKEVENLVFERGQKFFENGKPFGLFSLFCKKTMNFIGQIDLLPFEEFGTVEIGFILHQIYQNQGFCTEAVQAFLFDYIDELNLQGPLCEELPICKVIATVHPMNQSSRKILQKMGMSLDKINERFGQPRLWYSMPTSFAVKNQKIGM